jgi:L-lactate dehydrogenase complex protein LldF
VFRKIGGHSYGTVYGGPIGSVLMPHLGGLNKFQHLSFASSLCGACTSACPVKIDLHHHLLENRRNAVRSADRPASERLAFKLWSWTMMDCGRFAFFGRAARMLLRATYGLGLARTPLDPMRPWTKVHAAPELPMKSFRALWKEQRGAS